ncbi:HET-domain-containing protein [Teratosphaeria destructans]|uniref:HET-domain-containing protein n=1 Tax=Teratosphaeria destructans TaxID=418781 RepID=A0A9W7SN30_9PEZI|nr:HET-domain-containing protein [Teratosphaeria destructans]
MEISRDGHSVRLVLRSIPTRYAALSYCWGGDQLMKTTKETLSRRYESFQRSALPATIGDAIKVAEGLGIQYLWVDSMCIVQDDRNDMLEQIANMHNIYRGSAITIAAIAASNSSTGFLQPRTDSRPIIALGRGEGGTPYELVGSPDCVEQDAPLRSRAWAFQEGCLATRVLTFEEHNMEYHCREAHYTDGALVERSDRYLNDLFTNPGIPDILEQNHPLGWLRCLEQYSRLALSKDTDRLPALAALAEEYARRTPITTYHAGLWADESVYRFLWKVKPPGARSPSEYCGPSWSWCGVIGPIEFQAFAATQVPCSTVDAVTVRLVSEKVPYGRVSHGRLVLTGPLASFAWIVTGDNGKGEALISDQHSAQHSRHIGSSEVVPDIQSTCPQGSVFRHHIITLAQHDDGDGHWRWVRGLLLEKVDESRDCNRFRRIGVFSAEFEGSTYEPDLGMCFKGAVRTQIIIL